MERHRFKHSVIISQDFGRIVWASSINFELRKMKIPKSIEIFEDHPNLNFACHCSSREGK